MSSDDVVDGDTAQEIAPKGGGMVAVKLPGGGLLNGGEGVGRRGGPELGQARGAIVLILAAEVLFFLRSAPLLARALLLGGALLGLRIVSARGRCTAGCRQRFAGGSPSRARAPHADCGAACPRPPMRPAR